MMVRRSTPQKKLDESAFPIRVRFAVPDRGFGLRLNDLHRWLNAEIGSGHFAVHSSNGRAMDAIGVYLRSVECAQAVMTAFPDFGLADGVDCRSYSSPAHDSALGGADLFGLCNLYSMMKAQDAIRALFDGITDNTGNLPPLSEIYSNKMAPVVANTPNGLQLTMMRWGMPSPAFALKNRNYDRGITNVRNTQSPHWRRWLGPQNRCLVPFTAFAEPGKDKKPVWFELTGNQPIGFFAGIWTQWTSVRKVKDGETTDNLFGFLTCDPNEVVAAVHPKAMPVILTEPDEWERWLNDANALELQRPSPSSHLQQISRNQ
ncbi:SOS response-associated peptidase [Yoonia sp. SDW83-1]|uniref:SOS response-associated peptidase n=1 Tax=Yoonia sp. SDW83-1 TaxID=3366945 RepID=UPI00398C3B8D